MRVWNWPELFSAYLRECQTRPFAWGEFDCCLFACDAIKLMTGIDPAENFRGRYNDVHSALEVIATHGGDLEQLAATVAAQYGLEEVPVNFAQTGDIVVINNVETDMGKDRPMLGVMGSDGRPLIPIEAGLASVPRESVTRAFRI